MCTAILYKASDSYFGRNLDVEHGYQECVVITPRNYECLFRHKESSTFHYALIGMATVIENYPLYFDATNEKGLSMAALNFPDNACYFPYEEGKDNIAPFEIILRILGQCATVEEAKELLKKVSVVQTNFSEEVLLSPLHWIISDKKKSIVVESVKSGLKVYDNEFDVLTNNPPFEYHKMNMNNYMDLHSGPALNLYDHKYSFHNYSLGMGALGLPGDYSSVSRFVRAFFVKENILSGEDEKSNLIQFFWILGSVSMPKGCVKTKSGHEYTRYTSCCNVEKGIYYYKIYDDLEMKHVSMRDVDLNDNKLYICK